MHHLHLQEFTNIQVKYRPYNNNYSESKASILEPQLYTVQQINSQ